ncbi:MAG: oligoribonuclease [Micrococcales bacterium 73-13]|nr:MAG: oligoribonuclease [Micrococcales bacterium 73-13]
MAASPDLLVWIDCEMTGLDLERDELIEVAVVITDYELNAVDPGFQIVIAPSAGALDGMAEYVRDMHTASGLLEDLAAAVDLAEAERQVLDYIVRFVPAAGTAPLAGNTIGTDRAFLGRYMPRVDAHLHYRSVDVSSIKELSKRWYPRVFFHAPVKHGGHRALADIRESIRELEYYRRAVFVAPPGPSSEEAQQVADAVTTAYTGRL